MKLVKGSRKFMRKLVTETHNKKDEFSSKLEKAFASPEIRE